MFSSFYNIFNTVVRWYSIEPNSAFSPNSYGNELYFSTALHFHKFYVV